MFGLPLFIYATRQLIRTELDVVAAFRRALVFLACGDFFLILRGLWRHLSREDYLPFHPLFALVCVALVVALARKEKQVWLMRLAPVAIALLVTLVDLTPKVPRSNHTEKEVTLVRNVLTMTDPDDYVIDCKGETVFRRRAFYYVLERLTLDRIQRGSIRDELAQQSIAHRACLAARGGDMPIDDMRFLRENYVLVAHGLRVAGCLISAPPGESARFNLAIPASYVIVSSLGAATGLLDGIPYTGARFLHTGQHEFRPFGSETDYAAVWEKAAARKFTPFFTAVQPAMTR